MLGADTSPFEASVQMPGYGWRMPVKTLRAECENNPVFRRRALLYAQALSVQSSFSVASNARHSIEQRLARWLSAARDRVTSGRLSISQDRLAIMLGCRRASVSSALANARDMGLIRSSVGQITILDREGLRAVACPCYNSIKKEYRRLLL